MLRFLGTVQSIQFHIKLSPRKIDFMFSHQIGLEKNPLQSGGEFILIKNYERT